MEFYYWSFRYISLSTAFNVIAHTTLKLIISITLVVLERMILRIIHLLKCMDTGYSYKSNKLV